MTAPSGSGLPLAGVNRLLGIRRPEQSQADVPFPVIQTISIGSYEAFAAEPQQARGVNDTLPTLALAPGWAGGYLQALGENGIIIEQVVPTSAPAAYFIVPQRPFAGGSVRQVAALGGRPVRSTFVDIENQPNPPPDPATLGGFRMPASVGFKAIDAAQLVGTYVPPGAFLGFISGTSGAGTGPSVTFVWRELEGTPGGY